MCRQSQIFTRLGPHTRSTGSWKLEMETDTDIAEKLMTRSRDKAFCPLLVIKPSGPSRPQSPFDIPSSIYFNRDYSYRDNETTQPFLLHMKYQFYSQRK